MSKESGKPPAPGRVTACLERGLFIRRGLTIALFAAVSLAMGWSALGLRVDAGFTKHAPLEHPYMQMFLEHREEFGGADRIVLALIDDEGDIFTPEYFAALGRATDAMFFLPGVDRTQVFSIMTPNVRFVEVVEDGIIAGNVLPADLTLDGDGFTQVRENIIKAGLVGRLVANDFSGTIVAARLQEFHPDTGERLDYVEVARQLERLRQEVYETSQTAVDVHIIGFAKAVGDISAGATDVAAFFAIAFVIAFILVYAYTRASAVTGALLACSLLAVVWQLGILNALGFGIDRKSVV